MQGVRTTRGCIGCQRRKKGCDLQKPQCGRCQRLRATCTYEPRRWMFMYGAERPSTHASRTGQTAIAAQSPMPLSAAQRSLVRTDRDMQIEATFWDLCLPQEDPSLDGSIDHVHSAAWLLTARALAQADACLRTAIQACSYSTVGWMHNDRELAQRGLTLYAQALRQTNDALADPLRAQADSILACCRVLSLFEMFRRDSSSSSSSSSSSPSSGGSPAFDWEKHVKGTFRMVELRGLAKHRSGHGLALYDAVRMPAVIQALGKRKPNSFTSLSWDLPEQTSLRDNLFNIACRVPELLQLIDVCVACMEQTHETQDRQQLVQQSRSLIERCTFVGTSLCEWEASALNHCAGDNMSEPSDDSTTEPQQLSLINQCKMHGYGFFFVCNQYWAVCVKLYGSALLLFNKTLSFADPNDPATDIPPLPSWIHPEQHALNIADTTPHFFQPGAGLWAAQSAIFPVTTALFYFMYTGRSDSVQSTQMKDAFVSTQAGVVVSNFLDSIMNR